MAGIEKVCEYSGEYPGRSMYGWKQDSIQIMPKYRKLFRDSDVELVFTSAPSTIYTRKKGNHVSYLIYSSADAHSTTER